MARKSVTVPVKRLPSEKERRRLKRRRYRWSDSTRSGRLKANTQGSEGLGCKSSVKIPTRTQMFFSLPPKSNAK